MKSSRVSTKYKLLFLIIMSLLLVLVACADSSLKQKDNSIDIGMMLAFTGTYAPLADSIKEGFELYLDQNKGVLGGKKVNLKYEDDEGNPKKAATKYRQLVEGDEVDLLIGTISSSVTYALQEQIDKDEIILLKPVPTGNELFAMKKSKYIFSTVASNWQNGYAPGPYVANNIGKQAVTIAPDYAAGYDMMSAFQASYEGAGGKVIEQIYPELGTSDFAPYLTKIKQLDPEVVFSFMSGSDAIRFVEQYDEFGLKDIIPLTGTMEFGDVLVTEPTAETAEGIISGTVYSPWLENEKNEDFVNAYEDNYDKLPNIFSVGGYDTAHMLDKALSNLDSVETEVLVEELNGISFESPRGTITFDSETNNPILDFYITKNTMEEGHIVPEVIDIVEDVKTPETLSDKE